ncbi:MAG TPA: ATP-binding protein, partial [Pyrinomonadaceae bacterium]|nr:ATP-binding protein [Pyrinomonadaceae bacterium]
NYPRQYQTDPSHLLNAAAACNYCREVPETNLRAFADSQSCGAAVLDEAGDILYVNSAWVQYATDRGLAVDHSGIGHDYLEGLRQASDALNSETAEIAAGVKRVVMGETNEFEQEYFSRGPVDDRWIRIHASLFDLPCTHYVIIIREDITESRQNSPAIKKQADRLQQLLSVTHVFPWEADFTSGTLTFVGDQALGVLGYPVNNWYLPGFWQSHLHPEDLDTTIAKFVEYSKTLDNFELEFRTIDRNNTVVWLHNLISVVRIDGEPRTLLGFAIDVTESKEFEAVLKDLSSRLINAQEEERRRVARELHDDLNQRMAILSIELEQLGKPNRSASLNTRLQSLQTKAQQISADIHQLSYKLHPSKLDHLGLAAAIKGLCQELSSARKLDVEFAQSGFPANLPEEVTLCVYRIAQEALRNCVKHSHALGARVSLENTGKEVRLTVADTGRGFDPDSNSMRKGLGFTSMHDRLRIVGGKIQIHAKPNIGTRIVVSVPVGLEVQQSVSEKLKKNAAA